jgi:hypothetical protein
VGAVNCAKEKTLCSEYFAVTSYPMLMMVGSSERGTQQIYSQKGVKDASSLTDWARKVAEEWRSGSILSRGGCIQVALFSGNRCIQVALFSGNRCIQVALFSGNRARPALTESNLYSGGCILRPYSSRSKPRRLSTSSSWAGIWVWALSYYTV